MTTYRCIRCGQEIEISKGDTIGTCGFCGVEQAVPVIKDDSTARLYITANRNFSNNEYDMAKGNYAHLAEENPSDPFPIWMLLLCKYGVQYCKNDESSRWKPVIRRFQERKFVNDNLYDTVITLADEKQKTIFIQETEELERLRKRIEGVSMKEMPVDVFISYKEKDEASNKTDDSSWAETLYHDLKRRGLRVFYAPVSLKGKVGDFYEPYIYAAIHSAKVMIVLGTKPEYFLSPWVRNEWDRFLDLKNNSRDTRLLMTVYRNMTPDELPKKLTELLQIIEMNGDWLKMVEDKVTEALSTTGIDLPQILKRAFEFLEEGNFKRADDQCELMLNTDQAGETAYAMAYVGKLMIALNVKTLQELSEYNEPFDDEYYYCRAIKEGSDSTTALLEGYSRRIKERKEYNRQLALYNDAKNVMETADVEESYREAAKIFALIPGFRDAIELHSKCLEIAENCRKENTYHSAVKLMGLNTIEGYSEAIKIFDTTPEWKDSLDQAEKCRLAIENIKVDTYAKGKMILLKARTLHEYNTAASYFEMIKGYEESDYLAEYSKKAAKNAEKQEIRDTKAKLLDLLCNGSLEDFEKLVKSQSNEHGLDKYLQLSRFYKFTTKRKVMTTISDEHSEHFTKCRRGDVIMFGRYWQDSDGKKKSPIEWQVLDIRGKCVLLISRFALDCKPYNTLRKNVTWEECTLREWLNNSFYNEAFNGEEKKNVSVFKNSEHPSDIENVAKDKIFLLSIEEALRYFPTKEERKCKSTAYAISKGIYSNEDKNCVWRLRSSDTDSISAAYVHSDGGFGMSGFRVNNNYVGVRPVLWLNIEFI